jgi:hypothetical protein
MSGGAVVHSFSEIFRKIQPYPKDFQSRSAERENPRNMKPHQLLAIIFIAVCSIGTAAAERFAVKNTNATGPDSLDQAIVDANAHPNTDANTRMISHLIFRLPIRIEIRRLEFSPSLWLSPDSQE